MSKEKILPVILSGGSGSRLWPLSRASFPKQYLSIDKKESLTFFQETIKRISDNAIFESPIVICNEEDRFIVAEQLRNIKIKANSILLEPVGRNTAPAITLAAINSMEKGNDPYLLILPSDHLITNLSQFKIVLESAIKYVKRGKIVTFGITPNKPETGYGYIEAEGLLDKNDLKGEKIVRFIEKPNKELAEKLSTNSKYSWNSGIFFFKASVFVEELNKTYPSIYSLCEQSLAKKVYDLDFYRVDKSYFESCESISIDNAIMEKTSLGIVLPLDAGWSDIGSWQSLWEVSEKDENKNVTYGNVLIKNVTNSYLRSEERLMVALDIEDLVIIETSDAILIANKSTTQEVKKIVKTLETQGRKEATLHKKIYRPWGNYSSIAEGTNWQVKKIIVKPQESLSLQMHKHRSENWIVVSGTALVEIDEIKTIVEKNESAYIPAYSKHRLSNPSKENLVLIEVQSGIYLGEDDIIRFEDKYGRLE